MACKQGRAERRLLIQMHAVILPLLRVKGSNQQNHAPQLDALVASPHSHSMPRCHTSLPNPCLTEKRQTHLHTSGALTRRSSGTSRHVPLARSHPPTKTTCRRSSSAARARCRSQAASASIVIPRKSCPSAASLLRSNAFASCLSPVNVSCASFRCLPPP